MNYELRIKNFSGPIEKLLELIEEKKLNITELSLAEVTADFLNYLKVVGKLQPGLLADFLVVATKLLLIKSKALIPELKLSREEETEIQDFTQQLILYKEFKKASQEIARLAVQKHYLYTREFLQDMKTAFYPPPNAQVTDLSRAMNKIFNLLKEFLPNVQKITIKTIKLEEKIAELLKRLSESVKINFKDLTWQKTKTEIIANFLAVLHILQDHILEVEQKGVFSDIIIKKRFD